MLRRSASLTATVCAAALSLGACAGDPELARAPSIAAPDGFIAAAAVETAGSQTDWIASLNDPELPALVEEALAANPDVLGALANWRAAQAGARNARSGLFPSLDGQIGAQSVESQAGYGIGLDASWQPDVWGRLSDQARAGVLSAEAAQADLYGARLAIAAATANAWFALTEARLQTEIAERDVATRERQLDIVERRFARGVTRSSDVRTARSTLASAEASLAGRVDAERRALNALETLLGRYPESAMTAAGALPEPGALPAVGGPAELIARRPDVAAAERRLAAAGFSAEAARKALYPSLNLSASVENASGDFSDLFTTTGLTETLSASLLAPIFDGGARRATRDQRAAEARAQAADYVSTALDALEEAETAIHADGRLAERVAALEIARSEADAALGLVERQYASGVATIFELIDAQTRLTQAESALIEARRARLDNRIALHLAVAGDFSAGGGIAGDYPPRDA